MHSFFWDTVYTLQNMMHCNITATVPEKVEATETV